MFFQSETSVGLLMFLLVLFQFKHFLADFVFQTEYMMRKEEPVGWQLPLTIHAGVHCVFTFAILLLPIGWYALIFAVLDFALHWLVDYWKAQTFRHPMNDKRFWHALGFDQMLHHLSYLPMAYMAVHFA